MWNCDIISQQRQREEKERERARKTRSYLEQLPVLFAREKERQKKGERESMTTMKTRQK
jgi:hypothetical protein